MTRTIDEAIALAREAIRHRGDLTGAYRVLAVAAGMIGQTRLARTALAGASPDPTEYFAVLDRDPVSLEDDADREHYLEGFRRAGLE